MNTSIPATQPNSRCVQQAVFVIDHPEQGSKVIARAVFKRPAFIRNFLRPLDECSHRDDIIRTANLAIQTVYRTDMIHLQWLGTFLLRGLRVLPVESTVFLVEAQFLKTYRLLPNESYLPLDKHPSEKYITPILTESLVSQTKREAG